MTAPPPLADRFDARHDTPLQRRLRRLAPWPVGAVFIERPGMSEAEIRATFRLMKQLGFNCLKQCQTCRGTDNVAVMNMAVDEGLIPFYCGEGVWEEPTPARLAECGIGADVAMADLRRDPRWLARQERRIRSLINDYTAMLMPRHDPVDLNTPGGEGEREVPGAAPTFDYPLRENQRSLFIDWLKRTYGDIAALNRAWNVHHCMIGGPGQSTGEFETSDFWQSWEQLEAEVVELIGSERREYRRMRDVLRFKADLHLAWLRGRLESARGRDAELPLKAGGEAGLFLPFAARATDMAGIADLMADFGTFYPSFHLAWHFEEVGFETVRPMYMHSSLASDWFKGGWAGVWEATGGPQQFTGYKAPFVPEVRDQTPGFTVDGGVMTQLVLSWIAGGFKGWGLWAWNSRTAGWEGGEYALVDRNGRPTDRARVAGAIGAACNRLRDELWAARKEPIVGVLQDWDMEAIWAAMSIGGRDFWKSQPIRARIGASRALINANVPWEHVTGADLRAGLAGRYRTILLPAAVALAPELIELLRGFVEAGGRVVLDAPGGWFDDYGRVLSSDDGSPLEQLFGCRIGDYQYSRPGNVVWSIGGRALDGCTMDLQPTRCEVVASFDDGKPAVTEHRLGRGAAVILGFEATLACWRPGDAWMEGCIVRHALGPHESPYRCDGALCYRLAAPAADHYFLLNDGPATTARLDPHAFRYAAAEDPITQKPLRLDEPIAIAAHSGRWVRAMKA